MASIAQLHSCSAHLSAPLNRPVQRNSMAQDSQSPIFAGGFAGLQRHQCRSLRWQSNGGASRQENRRSFSVRAADAASVGAGSESEGGSPQVFPRISVRDPYKRLGIDPEATSEELQEARNYLVKQYEGHEKSRESIEGAYDKIIAMKLKSRKKRGMNLKAGLAKKDDPLIPTPKFVTSFFNSIKTPAMDVILKRAALYAVFVAWSVVQSAEQGPAFQLFVALATTVYFLKQKTQKWPRSIGLSLGALLTGWFLGSIVPVALAAYIPPTIAPELVAGCFSLTVLWAAATFLN